MVGLPSDEQRSTFVNNLQMSLFAWLRQNPAGEQPMRGLLVMDEAQTFVPADHLTTCSTSTLALASQGRKYGLGLVFATQAPRDINSRVPSNTATQFFGLLNSPMQIATAREIAEARGFEMADISRLATGDFYASVKGHPARLMRSQTCLTHHPLSPLPATEVVSRARSAGQGIALP
jgi:DNA helicase HerA-like ATPase